MATQQEVSRDIAARLKGLREALDTSIEELAERIQCTVDDVLGYESGDVEIPVSYLASVAHACNVELTALISGEDARLTDYCLVKKGKGLSEDRRKDYDYKNLAFTFKGRRMEPFMITVPPKTLEELSFTTHSGQEFIYMLEGRLEITLNKKVVILEEGDSFYFSSRIPHALRGLDDKPATFLDIIT